MVVGCQPYAPVAFTPRSIPDDRKHTYTNNVVQEISIPRSLQVVTFTVILFSTQPLVKTMLSTMTDVEKLLNIGRARSRVTAAFAAYDIFFRQMPR